MNYNYDIIISDNLKKLIEQVNMALVDIMFYK